MLGLIPLGTSTNDSFYTDTNSTNKYSVSLPYNQLSIVSHYLLIVNITVGLSWVAGLCDEGHYCPIGSSSPTQVVCTMGYYCPTGK